MNDAARPVCLNCGTALTAAQRYCGQCGQRVVHGRLAMHDIGHDLLHAITHADHSIFSLVKDLALRPGRVAREYIDGKRKKYFGPFAFLFIAVGFASFAILVAGVRWFAPINDSGIATFLQRHINLVILMQAPVLAGLCKLFFYPQRLNYAEHLVLTAYTSGFRCLFLSLIGTPVMYFTDAPMDGAVLLGYYSIWFAYFTWASVQFYEGRWWWSACKALVAAILTQVIAIYLVFAFVWTWVKLVYDK
jgi:hypothetical protein